MRCRLYRRRQCYSIPRDCDHGCWLIRKAVKNPKFTAFRAASQLVHTRGPTDGTLALRHDHAGARIEFAKRTTAVAHARLRFRNCGAAAYGMRYEVTQATYRAQDLHRTAREARLIPCSRSRVDDSVSSGECVEAA